MYRRRILASLGAVAGTALAGCAAPARQSPDQRTDSLSDVDLPVPEREIRRALPRDAIQAVTDPAFGPDWTGITVTARDPLGGEPYEVDLELRPDDEVIGVAREGEARAYPLRLLDYHEVVNDEFAGPLLVTYCPLCGSGVTAERRVDGAETTFGVSGLLWRSDLVMYDRQTESLWSQILGRAIRGPRTGEYLSLVPSTLTTLANWRDEHPETSVLLPPPISGTVNGDVSFDYERDPYAGYEDNRRIGVSSEEFEDDRLHPKAVVLGIASETGARAYPYQAVADRGVVNDRVGDRPVVVATVDADGEGASSGGTIHGYVRRVDGDIVRFAPDGPTHMRGAGSRWSRVTGRAVDGAHEGRVLEPASTRSPMFWFAWLEFRPDTTVYGVEG